MNGENVKSRLVPLNYNINLLKKSNFKNKEKEKENENQKNITWNLTRYHINKTILSYYLLLL